MSKRKSNSFNGASPKRVKPTEGGKDGDTEDDDDDVVCPTPSPTHLTSEPKVVGEVGIVEKITLKNFMCHTHLGPFRFGSNVNFVVGNNGSGKSAVLTALIVALGGKAQATNRGSSLKGFVKEGESSADVSITLRNRGKDAYRPEVYGQAIIVDLKITREGVRTYKLRSEREHLVTTKKEELMAIVDHFNIQVHNPVSILTQEMSKHFLHSKGKGDKYLFFMKATQLEQMKEDYTYIKTTQDVTRTNMDKYETSLVDLKKKYLEKRDQFNSLSSLDGMNAKLEELRNQMAWALVNEMEKTMKPLRDKLKADERSTVKYDQKVDEWKAKVVEAENKYKAIRDQLEDITLRAQQLQPQCAQLKEEANNLCKPFKEAENRLHRLRTNLMDLEKDKDLLSKRIDELRQSISKTSGAESQVRAKRIESLVAELESLNHQDSTLGQQIDQYQQAANRAKEEFNKIGTEEQVVRRSLDANQRNLATMEASRSDRLCRFGNQMPSLLDGIEDAHRRGLFRQKPRGPLGYCINLRDPDYALAVETCLKGQLLAFTCDNYEDERVLQGLMGNRFPAGRRPSIITCPFLLQQHDTSHRAVMHPNYPSVLQALEIEDPVVANCLIDQRGIESILLIKNRSEAQRVMQGNNPPKNCTQAFTKDGDQLFTDRSYAADVRRANYLSRDVEEEISHLRAELENQRAHMGLFHQQRQKVQEDIRQNEGLLKKAHMEQKKTKDKMRGLQLEMTDLENVEEPQSEDLNPLEEELQYIIDKIGSASSEVQEARAAVAKHKASYKEADRRYCQHKEQISAVTEEAEPIKEELTISDQEVEKSKHHKRHYEEKRKAHLSSIKDLKDSVELKEQELTTSVGQARNICPERLEVSRTANSLDSEISRLKIKISTQQEHQGDREEVIRQYQEAMENYNFITQQVKSLNSFIRLLDKIVSDRQRVYCEFRRFLSVRCRYYFDSMLNQRGYTGKMTFDHKNETLSISVQPGEGGKAALSDMRSLSGGERSFSTVCFVLSLWAISEAPFRCLDEFDVYMDMVNRRISMDMMLKIAASQSYRQFIFLTPQSMSSLPVNNMIHILRLNDPDRNQMVLPFGQRNLEEEEESN